MKPIEYTRPNFDEFKFKACIDWIELAIKVDKPTQFRHLMKRIPPSWLTGRIFLIDGESSGCVFKFRLQDPPSVAEVRLGLAHMGVDTTKDENVAVSAIEIALDLYPRCPLSDEKLAKAAYHLLVHHSEPPGLPLIKSAKKTVSAKKISQLLKAFGGDSTVVCQQSRSSEDMAYSTRHYVKKTDTRRDAATMASTRLILPPEEIRVRMEVTLQNERLPFATLGGWDSFRFSTLSNTFSQVALDRKRTNLHVLYEAGMTQDTFMGLGAVRSPKAMAAHRRTSRRGTVRDSKLNEKIRSALRGLDKKHTRAKSR